MIDAEEMNSKAGLPGLTIFGWACTVLWVLIVVGLTNVLDDEFLYLDLNELGDFLAGLVAPIAFLWFVIAFYQQKAELNQNSAALRLQAQEMKNAVAQATQQADAQAASAQIARVKTILEVHREAEREIRASLSDVHGALLENNHVIRQDPSGQVHMIGTIISPSKFEVMLESDSPVVALRYIEQMIDNFINTPHFQDLVDGMREVPERRSIFLTSMHRYTRAINLWRSRLVHLDAEEAEMLTADQGAHISVRDKILKLYVKIENALGDDHG